MRAGLINKNLMNLPGKVQIRPPWIVILISLSTIFCQVKYTAIFIPNPFLFRLSNEFYLIF